MIFKQKKSNQAYFYAATLLAGAAAYAFATAAYLEGGVAAAGALLGLGLGLRGRGAVTLRRNTVKYWHRDRQVSIQYVDVAFVIARGKDLRFFFRDGSELLLNAAFLSDKDRVAAAERIETLARHGKLPKTLVEPEPAASRRA